jgi:hypothetical protein
MSGVSYIRWPSNILSGPSTILALHEKINLTLQHAMLGTGGIEAGDSIKCAELLEYKLRC